MDNSFKDDAFSLDAFDRKILSVVQKNNQMSHANIGEQIGLSGSSVRRRLAQLRETGVIARDVALLDGAGFGVTLLVTVHFGEESLEIYNAFENQMRAEDAVRQCYHIAGEADYFLAVHTASLAVYEAWAKALLMSNEAIRRYDTVVVWSCKKFETAVVLD